MEFIRRNYVNKLLFFIIVILLCLSLNAGINRNNEINPALAEEYIQDEDRGDNLSGFAWSSNFGWISFNCFDKVCTKPVPSYVHTFEITDGIYDPDSGNCSDGGTPNHTCAVCEDYPWIVCTQTEIPCKDPDFTVESQCVDNRPNDPDPSQPNGYGVRIDSRTGTTSGYAWGPYIGWIAFEPVRVCVNDHNIPCTNSSDCGGNTCLDLTNPATFPPDDYSFNNYCMTGTVCDGTNNCMACYDPSQPEENNIHGWAKVLILGEDGWMNLGTSSEEGASLPLDLDDGGAGMSLPLDLGTAGYGMYYKANEQQIRGFTWNASDSGAGMGWLSYNCADYRACSSTYPIYRGEYCTADSDCEAPDGECVPACELSDYKVKAIINKPPEITDMSAPNHGSTTGACDEDIGGVHKEGKALIARLKWTYKDDCIVAGASRCGQAYQITVNEGRDGGDEPPASPDFDTGKCTGLNACEPVGTCNPAPCIINLGGANHCLYDGYECTYTLDKSVWSNFEYGTSYSWWVTVWDDLGYSTTSRYMTNPDTENDDGESSTFTTYKHEFPKPYFTWLPPEPSQHEQIWFIGTSTNYKVVPPNQEFYCNDIASDPDMCIWKWSGTDTVIDKPSSASTTIEFTDKGNDKAVTLIVEDKDNYWIACSTSTSLDVQRPLPSWKEEKDENP